MTKHATVGATYELGAVVGRGTYSEVLLAKRISDEQSDSDSETSPTIVAVKKIIKSKLLTSEEREMPKREIENHETIGKHPNAVYMFESYEDDENVFLVLEMVEGGTLEDKLKRNPLGVPSDIAKNIIHQLLKAVFHLHERSLVHVDISPKNILLERNDTVKLCDFGMAQPSQSSRTLSFEESSPSGDIYGTQGYVAPEVVAGMPIDEKADIWSLGIVCYELLTGMSPSALLADSKEIRFPSEIWEEKGDLAKNFTEMLLCLNPAERPCIGEALAHPWFNDVQGN